MAGSAGGESAPGERNRVGDRPGRTVVEIEPAAGKIQTGEVVRGDRTEAAEHGHLQIAACDREVGGEGRIESDIRRSRDHHPPGARLGDVGGALKSAGEREESGDVRDRPGLGRPDPEGRRNRHGRGSARRDRDAVRRRLRRHLEPVRGEQARGDGDGGRRVGRRRARFEGDGVDLEVAFERGADGGPAGDVVGDEHHVRPLPGRRDGRGRPGLVRDRPVGHIGPVVQCASGVPPRPPRDEISHRDADHRVGFIPGGGREPARRGALDDVSQETGKPSGRHAEKRVGLIGIQPCVRQIEDDVLGVRERERAARAQAQGIRTKAVPGGDAVSDVEIQGDDAAPGVTDGIAQTQDGESGELRTGSVEQAKGGPGPHLDGGDELRISQGPGERERGSSHGPETGDGADRARDGERAALGRDLASVSQRDAGAERRRAAAQLHEAEGAGAGVQDLMVPTEADGGVASPETEDRGGGGGVVDARRTIGGGRERSDGLRGPVQVDQGRVAGEELRTQ